MKKETILISTVSFISFLLILLPIYQLTNTYRSLQQVNRTVTLSEKVLRIAWISPAIGDPYWEEVQSGIQEVVNKDEVIVEVHGGYRRNTSEMVKDLQMAISAKVDGIIAMGIDDPNFIQAVKQATESGIPVILVGVDVPNSLRKMYVGADHISAGRILGDKVRVDLTKKSTSTIGIIGHTSDRTMQMLRIQGLEKSLMGQQGVQVVKQIYTPNEGHKAMQTMNQTNDLLNRIPNLDSIVVLNGEELEAVTRVIQQRVGLEKIQVYTFQDAPKVVDLFWKGKVQAMVVDDPRKIGTESMKNLLSWISGKKLPLPSYSFTETNLLTPIERRFRDEKH